MEKIILSREQIDDAARAVADEINKSYASDVGFVTFSNGGLDSVAAVARAGLKFKPTVLSIDPKGLEYVSSLLFHFYHQRKGPLLFVDDLIDTGLSVESLEDKGFSTNCFFLIDKQGEHRIYTPKNMFAGLELQTSHYLIFPWEGS